MKKKAKNLTPVVLAQLGGKAVLKKYGKGHFKELAKLRWAKPKKKTVKK